MASDGRPLAMVVTGASSGIGYELPSNVPRMASTFSSLP